MSARPTIMRALLVAGIIGVVVSACSLGGTASSSTGRSHVVPGAPLSHFRGDGIEFSYPAAWSHRHPGIESHFAAPVIDLSSQPMVDPCATSGRTTRCSLPIHQLRPGGVVVVWTIGTILPLDAAHLPKGVRVRIARPGFCGDVGGDEAMSATVVVRHHRIYSMGTCLRGPDIADGERAVRAMLASAVPVD